MIKVIALDLDGTLLTGEKKITEENRKAIKLAKENPNMLGNDKKEDEGGLIK